MIKNLHAPVGPGDKAVLAHLVPASCRRALVIGIGGGGDVASTIHIANRLSRLGCRVRIASVPWERWSTDPSPGPVGLDDLVNARIPGRYALADGRTYACREHGCFRLQASRAAEALGVPVVLVPIRRAVRGFLEALQDYAGHSGVDLVIGVDAGGDVLARGGEDNLWSPLADQVSLAGLYRAQEELGILAVLAVHGLGCDGELTRGELLSLLARIAAEGGVLGFDGISRWDEPVVSRVMEHVRTEASLLPYRGFKGLLGEVPIRRGTRRVWVDLLSAVTLFLDTRVVYRNSPMARRLVHTDSIWRAKEVLNELGVYTELDLEVDLARMHEADPGAARARGVTSLRKTLRGLRAGRHG